jgi:peptidoglycan hydrolase-like protein with peptidoglycan-binding domain
MNISLTSPLTRGPHVGALQRQLKHDKYYDGEIDSIFGPETARAVYRAKYWLGYRKPDKVAGDYLYSLLKGTKTPTPLMKARIRTRTRKKKQTPIRLKMWQESGKHLGVSEHPRGSNICRFSVWYGFIGPWCAMFATYCGVVAKSRAFQKGRYYAYCPNILFDARAGRNNLAITRKPQTGDMVLYDWNNDGTVDHVELFGHWTTQSTFTGRGGNVGGMVQDTRRRMSDVTAFVHVGG